MKVKDKITEDNYKEVVLKRSIIICWVLLAICLVIKLFGGNFFGIMCESDHFIKFCEFCDKYYISLVFGYSSFVISSLMIIKCVKFKTSKFRCFLVFILLSLYWAFKTLITFKVITINTVLYNLLDFISLYGCCLVTYRRDDFNFAGFLRPFLAILMLLVFSFVSAFVKNIGFHSSINTSFLVGFIFMIDYYIMIVITYLYQKRRYLKWATGDGSLGSAKM